jgi:hypothetical protein
MERARRSATWATLAGLAAVASGLAILIGQAASEVLANPALSLVDGYWIGRLPWTAVGVDLVVVGSTAAVVLGTLSAWLAGGVARRILSSLTLAVAVFWWFIALLPQPSGAPCDSCPPPGPDPMTVAYSSPQVALLFLVLPAAIAGCVALGMPRTRISAAV